VRSHHDCRCEQQRAVWFFFYEISRVIRVADASESGASARIEFYELSHVVRFDKVVA